MKKAILASIAVFVISIGVVILIYVSNDHSECETSTVITYGDNGEKITTETHICKEKFNI
ncbi:MAG: hypothetical protein V7719_06845 [Psychroserpens sp.]|uniref:hypothetical protein n=1 Tax=Psychroserpens sp. TaxID=2020870 RepID=UPI0030024FD4